MGLGPGALSRRLAARLLAQTLKQRQTLDQIFSASAELAELERRDAGFVRAMVTGAFRELGRIDDALAGLVERPVEQLDPLVLAFLRIGAVQLWRLDAPVHAAVGETVAAAKAEPGSARAAGLINAVLRRMSEDPARLDGVSATRIWPDWLWAQMKASIGPDRAAALADAQLELPALHLTALDPAATAESLEGTLLPSGSVAVPMGRVSEMEGYGEGGWWVQDAAAALPARILNAQAGEHVLDLCAAPGGKTLQLAAAGAHVTAVDRAASRLTRVHENLARTGFAGQVEVVCADARKFTTTARFDAILVDAPCSALGTLARHPEGAWIKRPQDLEGFPKLQAEILRAAMALLKPGGRLVYCVCTPLKAEGLEVVNLVLKEGLARRIPIHLKEAPGFEACATDPGDLLTLPGPGRRHDAFYIARLTPAES
ncbi:MAG: methyltransferase domain-containing protein [Hyphomonadaceae bacterium]|nr:methyltransferase domain-containing protein [Hyphomonadaceae bacterium]